MNVDRIVIRVAGAMILASIALGLLVSTQWFWLTGFVGANLLQASFTGFCPLAILLRRFGVQPGCAF
jgi:hypothetical protein